MNRQQVGPTTSHALKQASIFIVLLVALTLTTLMMTRKVFIPQTVDEIPIIGWHSPLSVTGMLLSAVMCLSLTLLLRKSPPYALFAAVSTLFTFSSLFLLNQYSGFPRADAGAVFQAMEAFRQNDVSSFLPGGYIHQYPHQIGLMYYYLIGNTLFGGYRWVYYGNLVWALVANWSIWQITKNSRHTSQLAQVFSILFPLFFLPHLLFILYGYNHTPSLALALLGIFFAHRGIQLKRHYFLFASIISLSAAVTIRQNFKILIIAVLLAVILEIMRNFKLVRLPLIALFIVPLLAPGGFQAAAEDKLDLSIGTGIPAVAWVTFGLQDSRFDQIDQDINRNRLPGWYNGYAPLVWEESGFDTAATSKKARQDLLKYASLRWNSPDHGLSFFQTKIESTWLEPTYQSLFFGALPGDDFFASSRLNSIYEGTSPFSYLVASLRGVSLIIFVGLSAYQILALKNEDRTMDLGPWIISTSFIGGFLFHLLWETKAAYVYPYLFFAIVPAALAFGHLSHRFISSMKKTGDDRATSVTLTSSDAQVITPENQHFFIAT